MGLSSIYADLHVHIGRDKNNKPVKITGSKTLTLINILDESSRNKGIDMVGVIDSHVPSVLDEINDLIKNNEAFELPGGGIRFKKVTLILGSEIEIYDSYCRGPVHVLCFFPTLNQMEKFSIWLSNKMTNIHLSSQRYYGTGKELQYKVKELEGLFIPAHVFTPFKSLYGKGVSNSLSEVFDPDLIDAIELGLSADTFMADKLDELHSYTFITNSDAHSLAKIAREYQKIRVKESSFKELEWALHEVEEREIEANYGMNPLLGKYHSTVCSNCLFPSTLDKPCKNCGSTKIIKGVSDRINELAGSNKNLSDRPPYIYQVPLEYVPGLGPKTYQKLLNHFGTEMQIIHQAPQHELKNVVGNKLADYIMKMRIGELNFISGGGGKYGKVKS